MCIKKLINKLFSHNVKTLEEFLKSLKENGCSKVSAYACVVADDLAFTSSVGHIGNHQYWVKLESETPEGRKIRLKKLILENFGSTYGLADYEEREASSIKSLIEADRLLKEVKKLCPDVETALLKPDGSPFSEKEIKYIWKLAKKGGVTN